MNFEQLRSAREKYDYIPARLVRVADGGTADITWQSLKLKRDVPTGWEEKCDQIKRQYSSVSLDEFHRKLLNDERDESLIHGLLSVVFWGFASGVNGRVNAERALAKSKAIVLGRKNAAAQDIGEILEHLREVSKAVKTRRIYDALLATQRIKFLGMSFGSKVVAFMNPTIAGVYDAIISNKLKHHTDAILRSLHISTTSTHSEVKRLEQCGVYEKWCRWCSAEAEALNGAACKWTDWDGAEFEWRAVDVERAFFSAR
jgi:hypothetical protein